MLQHLWRLERPEGGRADDEVGEGGDGLVAEEFNDAVRHGGVVEQLDLGRGRVENHLSDEEQRCQM